MTRFHFAIAALLAASVAACGNANERRGPYQVTAFAGDVPEPGAIVLVHTAAGELIDRGTTDAAGHTQITRAGDYVTVVFLAHADDYAPRTLVTTIPPDGDTLDVHGPAHRDAVPTIAGTLTIVAAPYGDSAIVVSLGCGSIGLPSLPATVDVPAACLGSDQNLDVVLTAQSPDPTEHGAPRAYAAGRVALAGGKATFTAPAWAAWSILPITADPHIGISSWTLWSDGLAYTPRYRGIVFPGLTIDGVSLEASSGDSSYDSASVVRRFVGVPASITIAPSDLPAEHANAPARLSSAPFTLGVAKDAAFAADVLQLGTDVSEGPYSGTLLYQWEAVVPPDVTALVFPTMPADLAPGIPSPSAPQITNVWSVATYLDSQSLDGFEAVQATGVRFGHGSVALTGDDALRSITASSHP